jgi:putative Mg2+ transporter-C (MgtC) family protein
MFAIPLIDQLQIVGSVFISAILGSLIGLERQRADKPAGLRTMTLISSASTLIVSLGLHVNMIYPGVGDPTRALHGVITGIGFLGAGTIAMGKNSRQTGVTTAATVFVSAAIGISVGLGAPLTAALCTFLVLSALRMGTFFERVGLRSGPNEKE